MSYLNGAATRKPSKRAATQRSTKMSSLGEPATAMTHLSYKEATHEGEAWAALWSPFGDSTDLPPQTVGLQPELHDLPQKSSEKSHPGGDPRTPERTGTQGPPGPSYAAGDARPFEPEWSVLIDVTAFQHDVLAVSRQRETHSDNNCDGLLAALKQCLACSHSVPQMIEEWSQLRGLITTATAGTSTRTRSFCFAVCLEWAVFLTASPRFSAQFGPGGPCSSRGIFATASYYFVQFRFSNILRAAARASLAPTHIYCVYALCLSPNTLTRSMILRNSPL